MTDLGVLVMANEAMRAPDVAELAAAAEAAGIESLWLPEHAALPTGHVDGYPYTDDGRLPIPPTTPLPDPLVWFGAAATSTTRLVFGTAYVVASTRNPVALAKQAASIDALAPGRLRLGLGTGWCDAELGVVDVPATGRADRLGELIGILRRLWAGPTAAGGPTWSFDELVCAPRPEDPPPVIVEAAAPAEATAAGRFGDGVLTRHVTPERTRAIVEAARAEADRRSRDRPFTVTVTGPPVSGPDEGLTGLDVDRYVALLPPLEPDRLARTVTTVAERWST